MHQETLYKSGTERLIALVPAALVALAIAAPLLPDAPWLALSIRRFFSYVCHQDPARSFWIAGAPVALCVRCLGIYLGGIAGALLPARRAAALRMFLAALAVNGTDIAGEFAGLHGNLPPLRFALGLLAGIATGALVAASLRESRGEGHPIAAVSARD